MSGKAKHQTPHRHHRDSSPELGSPSRVPQYNKRTGRPIRRGAGSKEKATGFLDSTLIDDEDEQSLSEDDEGNPVQPKQRQTKKRKRSPSLTPPPLEQIIHDGELTENPMDEEYEGVFHRNPISTPVILQFNVPLGFHGPLVVKLDRELLAATDDTGAKTLKPSKVGPQTDTATTVPEATHGLSTGFTNLPPELRNKIYRLLFVAECDLHLHRPSNFCRSSQLLRTCKLVHSEGCSILYGENKFIFDRNTNTRAPFWDPVPKEIGYKDIRQYLNMIGPENLQYIRDIKIIFEDARPASTPYLCHEGRRYLNDEHLLDVLRTLRAAKLRQLKLSFLGRRTLLRTDVKFLSYLEQVKADEIIDDYPNKWYYPHKIGSSLFEELKTAMTRTPKLYDRRG